MALGETPNNAWGQWICTVRFCTILGGVGKLFRDCRHHQGAPESFGLRLGGGSTQRWGALGRTWGLCEVIEGLQTALGGLWAVLGAHR